jgi:hypothetical protein
MCLVSSLVACLGVSSFWAGICSSARPGFFLLQSFVLLRLPIEGSIDRYLSPISQSTHFYHISKAGVDLPDGVSSSQTNPLRDRTVLLLRSRKLLLGAERFLAL